MKPRRYITLISLLCAVLLGCLVLATQTAAAEVDVVGPAPYQSPEGFAFAVPAGWTARLIDEKVYLVASGQPSGGWEDFVIQTCPKPEPDSCLGEPQMPAELIKVANTSMAGRPAQEYTYWRRNKPEAATRAWAEVHTMLTAHGKTFDVVAKIPTYAPPERWDLYEQIRRSFRLTDS